MYKGAWYNHKKSNKHLKLDNAESQNNNVEIQLLKKQVQDQKDMYDKMLLEQKNMFEEQKKLYENQIQLLLKQLDYSNTQLEKELSKNKSNTINNNTLNIVNYIVDNHKDTPAIEVSNDYLQVFGIDSKEKMKEYLLMYNDRNKLPHYFGDYFSKKYKKNNPKEQSIFCTDISRSNFLLRMKDNNEIKWIRDKGGKKLKNEILTPLIEYAGGILNDQIQNLIKNNDMDKVSKLLDALSKIKNKDIMNHILKQIGPDFQINETIINNAMTFINK